MAANEVFRAKRVMLSDDPDIEDFQYIVEDPTWGKPRWKVTFTGEGAKEHAKLYATWLNAELKGLEVTEASMEKYAFYMPPAVKDCLLAVTD